VKVAVSELGSCARLHVGSCVNGSRSLGRLLYRAIVCQVLWRPVGVHEVHYDTQFTCDPGFDRQLVQLLEHRRHLVVAQADAENYSRATAFRTLVQNAL